jgi:hypothetical protein
MNPVPPVPELAVGRREYDTLQADYIKVSTQLTAIDVKLTQYQLKVEAELTAVRAENRELLDFWKTAKGVNSFVMWLSKFLIGAGIITAFFKWGPLK